MEIWGKINGYDNYEVSSFGRVKSLGNNKTRKEKILKAVSNRHEYLYVNLSKNAKLKIYKVHQLVAMAFLNHTPCGFNLVVNHIDFNKKNNHLHNLEVVNMRENTNRKHLKSTSIYTGVYWNKKAQKWYAQIVVNKKVQYLGYFATEIEASNAYQNYLNSITNQ